MASAPMVAGLNLPQMFWQVVLKVANANNLGIASNCESNLRQFISHGDSDLSDARAKYQWDEQKFLDRVEQAKNDLTKFVTFMAEYSISQGWNELHEPSFDAAIKEWCPMWPFCE